MSGIHFFKHFRSKRLVRDDLSIDLPAVRREARRLYLEKIDFINAYLGAPRRFWHRTILRECLRQAHEQATNERHSIIFPVAYRMMKPTAAEKARLAELQMAMKACAVTSLGNANFHSLAREVESIDRAKYRRAYAAAIASITGNVVALQAAE